MSKMDEPKYCEACCNFDREHTDMGGMADCLITNVLTYSEACCDRCKYYNVPRTQPNEPLTLDELRQMDGEPVWTERRCGVVRAKPDRTQRLNMPVIHFNYGWEWADDVLDCGSVYRHKPEQEDKPKQSSKVSCETCKYYYKGMGDDIDCLKCNVQGMYTGYVRRESK